MKIAWLINPIFQTYEVMLLIRILSSWFPQVQQESLVKQIALVTDPYLAIFRQWIPPLFGTLDLSPMIALYLLHWLGGKCILLALLLEG